MHKGFLKIAAILGALSVMLGAFAAHGLKDLLPADRLVTFETAVKYQFYHVFALLAVALVYKEYPGKLLILAGRFFLTGILLFSGSLYLLCYFTYAGIQANWIGAITPFGGLAFITGWVLLLLSIRKAG